MQKFKIFLITLIIIILAGTSFKSVATAAQVTGINKSKGRIYINGGVSDGYIPGTTVCFFVSSVAYGNELVCGSVVSAEASTATVKISKSRAKKMKIGTEAMLEVEEKAKEETKEKAEKAEEETKEKGEKAKEETKEKEDWLR